MKKIKVLLLLLSFSNFAFSQITLKGAVSSDSIPLEAASVIIKHTKKGVATDSKGRFELEVKKGDTLSISYLGYETKNIVADVNESLNIKLKEDNKLNEVLIVAYSAITKCCGFRCYAYGVEIIEERLNVTQPRLYPNPSSSGVFQLKLNESYEEVEIMVSNLSGQTIQNSVHQKFDNKLNIDLSEFATGIYIVNIIADGKPLESIKAVRG